MRASMHAKTTQVQEEVSMYAKIWNLILHLRSTGCCACNTYKHVKRTDKIILSIKRGKENQKEKLPS